jgi:hypothetical protein
VAGVRDRETGRRDWMDREKLRRAWGRSRLTRAREAGGGGRLEADPRSVKKDRRNSSLIPILFRSRDMGVSTRVLGVGRYAVTRAVRFVETPVFTVKKIMCLRGAHHPNLESIRF